MKSLNQYVGKELCNAHGRILEVLVNAERWEDAEQYLWGCCTDCYVSFDPDEEEYFSTEIHVCGRNGLVIQFNTLFPNVRCVVEGETIYDCAISAKAADFLDEAAEKRWKEWCKDRDIKKYAYIPGWATVNLMKR